MEIKPSEVNQDYETGAVRGDNAGTGEAHLLPFEAMLLIVRDGFGDVTNAPLAGITELAKLYEAAKQKYPSRNWEKGVPLARYVDSAFRHLRKYLRGDTDEPHLTQFAWNLVGMLQTQLWIASGRLPDTLAADLPNVRLRDRAQKLAVDSGVTPGDYVDKAFTGLGRYVAFGDVGYLIWACGNALMALERE